MSAENETDQNESPIGHDIPLVATEKASSEDGSYLCNEQHVDPNLLQTPDDRNHHHKRHRKRGQSTSLMLNIPSVSPRTEGEISDSSENDAEVSCSCESHLGKEGINEILPVSVDQLFLLMFSDNPSYRKLQEMRKTTSN